MRAWAVVGSGLCASVLVAACGGGGSQGASSGPDASTGAEAGSTDGSVDAGSVDSGFVDAPQAEAEANAPLPPPSKMDVLFVVDNERGSFAAEQQLSLVVPDFLNGLLNPACVDSS